MDYLKYVERLMDEYYTTLRTTDDKDREDRTYRNPQLADLADKIAARLETEAEAMRHSAARWRGEH